MTTEHLYYYVFIENGEGKLYTYPDREETDVITIISTAIERSHKEKINITLHINGLSLIRDITLNTLYMLGNDPILTTRKSDLHVHEFRYLVSQHGAYFYQLKTAKKSFVTLQNIELVIGQKYPLSNADDIDKEMDLYQYIRKEYLGKLKRGKDTRILYSAGQIARGIFNRKNYEYSAPMTRYRVLDINGEKIRQGQIIENFVRPAYHGGLCYMSELGSKYRGEGIILDKNSLYPYEATKEYVPVPGIVHYGKGQPPRWLRGYKTFVTFYRCIIDVELKNDGIPCIYANSYKPELIYEGRHKVTFTSYDFKLLAQNYHVKKIKIVAHLTMRASRYQFRSYMLPRYEKKRTTQGVERDFNKAMMNNLLGTFGKKQFKDKITVQVIDGKPCYIKEPLTPEENEEQKKKTDGLVCVVAIINAAARYDIVQEIRKHPNRFLYSDTDSVHLSGSDIPEDYTISDKLGDFKVEHTFTDVIYKGQKEYMFYEDGQLNIKVSGQPLINVKSYNDIPDYMRGDLKHGKFNRAKVTIKDCIKHHKLDKLFEIPVPKTLMTEDLGSMTVTSSTVWKPIIGFKKMLSKKQKAKLEKKEWYDTNITMPRILKPYNDERKKQSDIKWINSQHPKSLEEVKALIEKVYRHRGYIKDSKTGQWWRFLDENGNECKLHS